jgi:hypothetical protein
MTQLSRHCLWGYIASSCLLAGIAHGQFDLQSSSLIQPPAAEPLPMAVEAAPSAIDCLPPSAPSGCLEYDIGGKARGYYLNDQRLEFTGMEATFAVEGVIDGSLVQRLDHWDLSLDAEIFLNQPFDRNRLVDTPERRSFTANFDIEPLQLSQLYLGARQDDFFVALGRFATPFGRYYYPLYRNQFDDSPFIRSEAISYRETGLLVQWDPDAWTLTAALTNGGFNQDANSSKALVARVGLDQPNYALGTSVKWQDGNGSESQKTYNNHVGVDAMLRRGNWTLSGEAIYDQYGMRRPGMPLRDIHWGRSLYYRDFNNEYHVPITGFGYYLNLGYEGPFWSLHFNYGEFYPEDIGIRRHDVTTRRGLIKASRHWSRHFETYAVVLRETDLPDAFDNSTRRGIYLIFGGQFTW